MDRKALLGRVNELAGKYGETKITETLWEDQAVTVFSYGDEDIAYIGEKMQLDVNLMPTRQVLEMHDWVAYDIHEMLMTFTEYAQTPVDKRLIDKDAIYVLLTSTNDENPQFLPRVIAVDDVDELHLITVKKAIEGLNGQFAGMRYTFTSIEIDRARIMEEGDMTKTEIIEKFGPHSCPLDICVDEFQEITLTQFEELVNKWKENGLL